MEHIVVPALARFEGDWHFSHVVRDQDFLFLSGVTGTDERGEVPEDPAEQFEQVFRHLSLYLQAAEASLKDLVEMTSYHVELRRHLDVFLLVKDRHILPPFPAWSAIGVSELITPGALVEIRVVARDPRSS